MPIQPLSAVFSYVRLAVGVGGKLVDLAESDLLELLPSVYTTGPTYAAGAIELCTTACLVSRTRWKYASGLIGLAARW